MVDPRPCNLVEALGVIGEKHSMLIIREILLGVRRFDALARNIGAPRDVLAKRLRRLTEFGVIYKKPWSQRPPRYEYRLTEAGLELAPALLTLLDWGNRHVGTSPPPLVYDHDCGAEVAPVVCCAHCGAEVRPRDLTPRMQAEGWEPTGPVGAAQTPPHA